MDKTEIQNLIKELKKNKTMSQKIIKGLKMPKMKMAKASKTISQKVSHIKAGKSTAKSAKFKFK